MRRRRSTTTSSTGIDAAHHVLGGIAQADIGEPQGLVGNVGPAAGKDDLAGGDDLVAGEGSERVEIGRCGRGGHVRLMLCAAGAVTLYDHPMEAAADRAAHSARELARRLGIDHHDVLVLLGSGLSGAAEVLGAGEESVPLDTLPFFPPYTAGGHRAARLVGPGGGLRLLVLGGRCHLYEGLTPSRSSTPCGRASPPAAAPSSSPPPRAASATTSRPGPSWSSRTT